MMFPDDFNVCKNETAAKKGFGIMDGGVVDNQGIEPILLAEERMHKCDKERRDKALELIIISDVSSSNMNGYSPCKQRLPEIIGKWTIAKLQQYALFAEIIISLLLIIAFFANNHYMIGAIAVIWGMVTIANVALNWINNKIVGSVSNTIIGKNASFINNLSFADIESLLMNRAKSVIMMRDYLKPSMAIQENSYKAANMGTTLWFTERDKEKGIPEAILAAGQYTICYNLLDYIDKIQKKKDNLNEDHQLIIACKKQLQDSWKKFQEDPLWMVSKYKK